jgi:hypothetical protein
LTIASARGTSCGGTRRPETADRDPDQRPRCHEDQVVRRERRHRAGNGHQECQRQQQRLAVQPPRDRGDEQRGQQRERAGNRDRLPRLAFADVQVGGDWRQQADRHEFGGDQREGAKRQRKDRAPCGRLLQGRAMFDR